VSKKTIAFTMPASALRNRERPPIVIDAVAEPAPPGAESETDEWVRDPDTHAADEPLRMEARTPRLSGSELSVTIDLAAERSLMDAVSLSFILPYALGWFWLANLMARRSRLWGL
jgi:hypothetical protein